ncbi:hypothetical protein LTR22_009718 [Elasticomyces elasticus]|nr:hypothetical protein LTR22_009718 [Elasticomyces elasticus]
MQTTQRKPDEQNTPYRPLIPTQKEIRVLLLRAGRLEDPIRCELHHASLLHEPYPRFETVSYVWGDPHQKITIEVDGIATPVGASAERVLRRFRLVDTDRTAWIDALCINQTDLEERSLQVALMADIYSKATHNLIWLGEVDGFSAQARVTIDAIVDDARNETEDLVAFRRTVFDEHEGEQFSG